MSWHRLATLGLLCCATSAQAAVDPIAERAVRAFDEVCLANAGSIDDARRAATSAPWSFQHSVDLPAYGGGAPMEGYASGEVELVIRPDKKGAFGCLIMFKLADATASEALSEEVSKLPSLTLAKQGKGKQFRSTWASSTAPKGSKVHLTIYGDMSPRAPILALESKGAQK